MGLKAQTSTNEWQILISKFHGGRAEHVPSPPSPLWKLNNFGSG